MKKYYRTLACAFAVIALYSCAKETPENTWPENVSSNGALQNFLAENAPGLQTYTIDLSQSGMVITNGQIAISWTAGALLYANGQTVTGNVTMECREVHNKQSALYCGASMTAHGAALVSGGEFWLRFLQNNQELELRDNQSVGVSMMAGLSPNCGHGMHEYYAGEIEDEQDFQLQSDDTIYYSDNPTLLGSPFVFEFLLDHTGWINVDRMMSTGEQTTFNVTLPQIFNGSNCNVYISYDGTNSMAQLYHYSESGHSYGSGTYYTLPVGAAIRFIAIAEIHGQFYYDEVSCTVTQQLSTSVNPMPSTPEAITARIAALP